MVRKQTWILLAVFAALLAAAFYLQQNPQIGGVDVTPSPTSPAALLPGLQTTEITWMDLQNNQTGAVTRMESDGEAWFLAGESKPVSLGKVEQIRTQILDTRVDATLSGDYALDALNLTEPAYVLTLGGTQEQFNIIRVGKTTPTGSGYYAQVNGQAPVVVSKNAVDTWVNLLQVEQLFEYTPTPPPTAPQEAEDPEIGTTPTATQ